MLSLAAYTYTTYTTTSSSSSGMSAALLIFYLILVAILIAAYWKIFTKAGQAGWKAIIPIYSAVILCRIVGLSGWYVLILLVPFVNIVFAIYLCYRLSVAFGHGVGMTILMFIFGIGALILGYGSSKYLGPDGKPAGRPPAGAAATQ